MIACETIVWPNIDLIFQLQGNFAPPLMLQKMAMYNKLEGILVTRLHTVVTKDMTLLEVIQGFVKEMESGVKKLQFANVRVLLQT